MSGEIFDFLHRTESASTDDEKRRVIDDMGRFVLGLEPEKLPPLSGPVTMEDGTVIEKKGDGVDYMQIGGAPNKKRGSVLQEAMFTINGERQDVYGSPEDSFALISDYWTTYLRSRSPEIANAGFCLFADDVAMMMTLFKIAREANQHKRDSIVDAAGYLGIYADMQEAE